MNKTIFVVGSSRSGTTMMGRILGANPLVFTFRELHFFEQLWDPLSAPKQTSAAEAIQLFAKLLSIQRDGYLATRHSEIYHEEATRAIAALSSTELQPSQLYAEFLQYESLIHGKKIACEQTPRNVFYFKEILETFPEARIVAMVRDPRGVLLSQKGKWKRKFFLGGNKTPLHESIRTWFNYHPLTITKIWRSTVRSILTFKEHPQVRIIQYENLLKQPEQTIRELCQFLGIEFQLSMLAVPQVGSSNAMDRPDRLGIDAGKAERWKQGGLNPAEIYLCQKLAKDEMDIFSYELEPVTFSPLILASICWFPFHLLAAFLFNLHRVKNIGAALKKRLL